MENGDELDPEMDKEDEIEERNTTRRELITIGIVYGSTAGAAVTGAFLLDDDDELEEITVYDSKPEILENTDAGEKYRLHADIEDDAADLLVMSGNEFYLREDLAEGDFIDYSDIELEYEVADIDLESEYMTLDLGDGKYV